MSEYSKDRGPEADNQPVTVTFADAQAYCRWASEQSGQNLRLPSELQLNLVAQHGPVEVYGPEWTSEGFIYDLSNADVNRSPEETDTAAFRLIVEPENSDLI